MKIVIVTNLYPPYARGGAEVVITRVVTELLAQGHQVSVITTKPYTGLRSFSPRLESDANERVYRFFPPNIYHLLRDHKHPWPVRMMWHIIDMCNPFNGLAVWKLIREIAPDVVWTHNLKGIGLTIAMALRFGRYIWVHQVHDVQLVAPSGLIIAGRERPALPIRLGRAIYAAYCRWIFGSPQLIISPSRYLQNFYQAAGFFSQSEVLTVPNPAPKSTIMSRGKRSDGPLRLLFVGQLERHKGIRFLVETLRKCEESFLLTVAGEGTQKAWVRQQSRDDDRLNYVGFLAMDQLYRLFHIHDVLVVPSLCYENSPTVIYEALQAGLPVVAADIGGVAELIQCGVNGYLFNPADGESLCEALMQINAAKDTWALRGEEVRATVADHVVERYVAKVVEQFERLNRMGSGAEC